MEIEIAGESVFPSHAISIYYKKMLIVNPLDDDIYQNKNSHLLPYVLDFPVEVFGKNLFYVLVKFTLCHHVLNSRYHSDLQGIVYITTRTRRNLMLITLKELQA